MRRFIVAFIAIALLLSVLTAGSTAVSAHLRPELPQAQRGGNLRFTPAIIREANKKQRYTIKARYPQAVGARNNPRLVKLNRELKQFVTGEVSGFTKDFSTPEEPMMSGGSTFDVRYQVRLATKDLVSIGFIVNAYFEGAIHGQYNIVAFNYDLKSGLRLKLADLFKPGSDYLKTISGYAIKSLTKSLPADDDQDWIQKGASAEEKNYEAWSLTRKGLEVTFNPYQVASYAEGPQVVIIPFDALRGAIDPNGPLARLAGKQ